MAEDNTDVRSVHSEGDLIVAEHEGVVVEDDWRAMKKYAEAILNEAEEHKTDLQKAEEINGAHVRVSCDCCDYEQVFEWARDVRERGQTPEKHADHPDFDCEPEDVTIEAYCPRHGTIPLAYDECDGCADTRATMNR